MTTFPKSGTTRGGYRYWIDHVNEDGSMCGRVEYQGLGQRAFNWGPQGECMEKGHSKYDILPPNEAAELLAAATDAWSHFTPGCIQARVLDYLKRQAEKPE